MVCSFNQEKALVGAFSGHYRTSRRSVDSSIIYTRASNEVFKAPGEAPTRVYRKGWAVRKVS